jgi:putative ergosteryl-3beta-O-L-aspartate hydrolase
MRVGMVLHRLAPPRPISPSFARTIPATVSSRAGYIALTFYTPEDYRLQRRSGWRFPVVINFHGGGFTLGAATDDARWATEVVREVDAVVVSVSYRLAPEQPFPTAVEDGVDAIFFLAEHADELGLDPHRIAVSGFSAGGNLAFTVPMRLQDELRRLRSTEDDYGDAESQQKVKTGGAIHLLNRRMDCKIVAVVAWYPPTDYTKPGPIRKATCVRPDQALPDFFVELFDASYIYPPGCDTSDPFLSPGVASDEVLSGLPDDIILFTCEWDMLRAEAERFGARLQRDLGKNVTHTMVRQVAHAWDRAPNPFYLDEAVGRHYKEACGELKRIFEES